MHPAQMNALRKPKTLIDNRVCFAGPDSELSIYDTYSSTSRFSLDTDQLLYCGMVTGRKIIHHGYHSESHTFLPHESFVIAPDKHIEIDFPDASFENPTTCLAIEISQEKINDIYARMNEREPVKDIQSWQHPPPIVHTHHTSATQHLLQRLFLLFTENHPDRDILIDLGVTELVIRMLRHQDREFLVRYSQNAPDTNGITTVINYIQQNLSAPLDADKLVKLACMSRSRLYHEFKKKIGCSPNEFHQQLRLKAAAKQLEQGERVTSVCYSLGFSCPSHFSRRFRHFFGQTPRTYRQNALQKSAYNPDSLGINN